MSAIILDGKALAQALQEKLASEVGALSSKLGRKPGLAVVLVGDNPASKVYVASKEKAAAAAGIQPIDFKLPESTDQLQLNSLLKELSARDDVDGILLQLPLPKQLSELEALTCIAPEKDADGLTPLNQGLLLRGADCFEPCTPRGCMSLIDLAMERLGRPSDLSGLHAVVVGRSVLVGKPVAALLLARNCTVEIAHSRTRDLAAVCRRADILVAAVGKPELITGQYVKPGAVVIDVGINRLESGKLTGDVEFRSAAEVAGAITPVPGGAGPMTIVMLLQNTADAARRRHGIQ